MKMWTTCNWIDQGIREVEVDPNGDGSHSFSILDARYKNRTRYYNGGTGCWHSTLEAAIAHVEAEIAKARHAVNRKIERIARASDMIAKLKGPSQ